MLMHISLAGLDQFAAQFWKVAGSTRVFAFHGPMGAGKTTTIAALCRHKGVQDAVSSPTFAIIHEYSFPENGVPQPLYHIDLYRLHQADEVVQSGVEDCVDSGALCLVEWPEHAPWLFDEHTLHVLIEPVSEAERRIKILTAAAFDQQSIA